MSKKHLRALTIPETTKLIKSIGGRSRVLVHDIHEAALNSLAHAEQHGNFTLMTNLYRAVSNGHKSGLVLYFRAFGPVKFVKADKEFRKDKTPNATAWDLVQAAETSPDDLDRELHAKQTEFDAAKQMQQIKGYLQRQAVAASEAGDTDQANAIIAMTGESSHYHEAAA